MSPIQIETSHNKKNNVKTKTDAVVVGIDLGTTNTLLAYSADKDQKPEVIVNIPSALSFDSEWKITEGDTKSFRSFKRLMAKSFEDCSDYEKKLYALSQDEAKGLVLDKDGLRVSPLELSSALLKILIEKSFTIIGKKPTHAVITVPAYFDDASRVATRQAAELAGIKVLRIINEPTAAAFAYGWSQESPGQLAVYDLGGGTFDVSVLRIESQVYEVLATCGDTQLGGDDFDHVIQEAFSQKKVQLSLMQARALKEEFSQKSTLNLDGHTYSYEQFIVDSKELTQKTIELFKQALTDSKLQASELNEIILVGGSTRMKHIKAHLEDEFKIKVNNTLNPDEVVAIGAARQAMRLSGQSSEGLLLDVIPLSLGIENVGGVVSKIISRNSTIPIEIKENYSNHVDNQTAFDIHILQGERELVTDCRSLARFKLRGLSPQPAGYHRIEICFQVDANGILKVRATDLRTDKYHEVDVMPSFGLEDAQVEKMITQSFDHAEKDIAARQLIDLKVEAGSVVEATQKMLNNDALSLNYEQKSSIRSTLIDLENSLKGSNYRSIKESMEEHEERCREFSEEQVNAAIALALNNKTVEQGLEG